MSGSMENRVFDWHHSEVSLLWLAVLGGVLSAVKLRQTWIHHCLSRGIVCHGNVCPVGDPIQKQNFSLVPTCPRETARWIAIIGSISPQVLV